MKAAKIVLASAFLLLQGGAFVASAARGLETVKLYGHNYVRLSEWAKEYNFDLHWPKHDKTVTLSNRGARIVVVIDSRQAQVNGLNVWLSDPVAVSGGAPYISEQDLDTAISPLVFPTARSDSSGIKNIVLDPGHGGRDPGNHVGSHQEKKYALLLAEELQSQLKRAGFGVSLTRTTDSFIELPDRPEIANRRHADIFISLHWNSTASGANNVKGVETYCLTPSEASSTNAGGDTTGSGRKPGNKFDDENILLAYEIQKNLHSRLDAEDRGVRRARFAVLRTAQMPAVLIEGGFMTHPSESRNIYDSIYRRKMAQAIVDGIKAYKSVAERKK